MSQGDYNDLLFRWTEEYSNGPYWLLRRPNGLSIAVLTHSNPKVGWFVLLLPGGMLEGGPFQTAGEARGWTVRSLIDLGEIPSNSIVGIPPAERAAA